MALTTTDKAALLAVGLGAVWLSAWYLQSRLSGNLGNVAAAVPGVASDIIGGVVVGTGEVFGIPRTDETECQKAIREGRSWAVMTYCPAATATASDQNIFAKGVDSVGGFLSGNSNWSLGGAIYDWTH